MGLKCSPRSVLARAITGALTAAPLLLLSSVAVGQDVDLGNLGDRGFSIHGIDFGDSAGLSVSGAGDVNGDGLGDLIIGALFADTDSGGNDNVGESYVVFGKNDSTPVDLGVLGSSGFRIDGSAAGDYSGRSVSGAGDVNGDGLADVIVLAPGAHPKGEAYVVFGKADTTPVALAELGNGGFHINGVDPLGSFGASISGAGDVNGDGLADLIIGVESADDSTGESYVVFGKVDSSAVNLAALGGGGFRITGIDVDDYSGHSVSGAGDVNGDGLADLIIGAYSADPGGAGESYVVFGKADSAAVNLAALGSGGFRIDGVDADDLSGHAVSGAGDVNGDGLADVIIGAFRADPGDDSDAGESYLVFGKADSDRVDLAALGSGGFRIDGIDVRDHSGWSVSGAGDINGDGLADLIIGAFEADPGGASYAGESYVVFGKADSTAVDLAALGVGGFRIDGNDIGDRSGGSVSGAGDVNGDGLADLIVGAEGVLSHTGVSYVIFSASLPPQGATYRVRSGNGDPPQTAVGISGDGSNDDSPDARLWIDFADGNDLPQRASSERVQLTRDNGAFAAAGATVSWQLQSSRQNWTAAEVTVRYLDDELLVSNENMLDLVFSATGSAPFTPLPSIVNPFDNTISATISEDGFLYIGRRAMPPAVFVDGFEQRP